jgi:hypothetical protein
VVAGCGGNGGKLGAMDSGRSILLFLCFDSEGLIQKALIQKLLSRSSDSEALIQKLYS